MGLMGKFGAALDKVFRIERRTSAQLSKDISRSPVGGAAQSALSAQAGWKQPATRRDKAILPRIVPPEHVAPVADAQVMADYAQPTPFRDLVAHKIAIKAHLADGDATQNKPFLGLSDDIPFVSPAVPLMRVPTGKSLLTSGMAVLPVKRARDD